MMPTSRKRSFYLATWIKEQEIDVASGLQYSDGNWFEQSPSSDFNISLNSLDQVKNKAIDKVIDEIIEQEGRDPFDYKHLSPKERRDLYAESYNIQLIKIPYDQMKLFKDKINKML